MFTFATFVVYLQENETVRNNLKSKHMRITNLMKTAVVATIAMLAANFDMEAKNIKLPAPERAGGMPMNEVVANRHSVRVFDPAREVETAKLGQALWLSVGVNRPDAKPEERPRRQPQQSYGHELAGDRGLRLRQGRCMEI